MTHDRASGRIRFSGGRLTILGVTLPLLPIFSIGDGRARAAFSGALVPGYPRRQQQRAGSRLALLLADRPQPRPDDHAARLHRCRCRRWRPAGAHLTSIGAYQIGGFVTYGDVPDPDAIDLTPERRRRASAAISKPMAASSSTPTGRVTGSLRAATDKTVTRQYDITRDDRLRSFINAERISLDSYVSIEGWAFQGLRSTDEQERIPDRPAGDRRPLPARRPGAGRPGRAAGQQPRDPSHRRPGHAARLRQRPLGPAPPDPDGPGADADRLCPRRCLSHRRIRRDRWSTSIAARTAGSSAASAHSRPICSWPLVGPLLGGTQRLTPRVQLVLTPPTRQSRHPQRGCACGRPRGQQPVRAQPLPRLRPLGRWVAHHLWRWTGPSTGRTWSIDDGHRAKLSPDPRAEHFPGRHRPDRPLVGHRRPHPRPLRPVRRRHPPLSASTRTISRFAGTSST